MIWWVLGAVCASAGMAISYWVGYQKGLTIGQSRGYTACYKLFNGAGRRRKR